MNIQCGCHGNHAPTLKRGSQINMIIYDVHNKNSDFDNNLSTHATF